MMAELLAMALIRMQIATAAAVLLIVLLRPLVRRLFGARLAYGLWIIAPVAAIACCFPSLAETFERGAPSRPLGGGMATAVLALWLVGCVLAAGMMTLSERAFRRRAERGQAGPAVMGALWPRIVVPADFTQRFTPRERELIQLHERTHIRRGDPIANLAVAACGVLGWCNPLVWLGVRLARIDQELACDATVLALRAEVRVDYARVLLRAQSGAAASPLACGWATHPLLLRVSLLNRPEPDLARQVAGFATLTALGVTSALVVWTLAPRGLAYSDLAPILDMDTMRTAQAARGFALP